MAPVRRSALCVVASLLTAANGCGRSDDGSSADERTPGPSARAHADVVVLDESFITPLDTAANVDGPAVYHGTDGSHWIIATAKSANALIVYDAATGAELQRVGGTGAAPGEFRRPNGIAVLDNAVVLVVERDNRRVQALRLPDFRPLGTFGEQVLRKPYGIAWRSDAPRGYVVYITDNYEAPDESVPPLAELGERVKEFRLQVSDEGDAHRGVTPARVAATYVRAFGDTTEAGAIRVAESIAVDVPHNRLLIAEELAGGSHIKVYDLAGRFTGRTIGLGQFPQEAEGIALYACEDGGGYWVTTDQGEEVNTFHVFDRRALDHLGAFSGAATRRTDGVALTQRRFGPFQSGVFLAAHLDGGIAALPWERIARALMLRSDCAG